MSADQKRAPDLITDGCEPPCGCRELNSGPLEEQAVLLTTEPSLEPHGSLFLITDWCARAQPWAAGPGFCKKADRANYESRPVSSTPPRASASVPASWFCLELLS